MVEDRGEGELLEQPDVADIELVKVLHALGDPTRLHLLGVYANGGRYDCSSERLGVAHLHKSTVSHHMRIMRQAGITSTRVVGRNRYVRLRRADLDARFPGLVDTLVRAMGTGDGPAAGN
ncbi:ArsR/SmtB family transcription factor [Streptomyces noursei]|uniref:ArsR/SmtB family transcription factor n=1 Tax=Streptomyces noursei TaxID=1971 RepID=UPI001673A7B4|nr:winged helix-turn-helix transcriptional regulator [Streptomyces noursei]MCZ1017462.1 transcriptional regulator [Streptomyces noursei]GGX19384.1 transcriptional regulator [Streptomyces noursei]